MSALLDSLGLDAERRADCARTDAAVGHKRTLRLGDVQVPLDSLNDDDVYVIDIQRRAIVEQFGASSVIGQHIKLFGNQWPVPLGCAMLTGFQAKLMPGGAVMSRGAARYCGKPRVDRIRCGGG